MTVKPKRTKMPLATFEGSIRVGQEKAAMAEEITLTFAYADTKSSDISTLGMAPVSKASLKSREDDMRPPVAAVVNA